jgi:hypothetical protein
VRAKRFRVYSGDAAIGAFVAKVIRREGPTEWDVTNCANFDTAHWRSDLKRQLITIVLNNPARLASTECLRWRLAGQLAEAPLCSRCALSENALRDTILRSIPSWHT